MMALPSASIISIQQLNAVLTVATSGRYLARSSVVKLIGRRSCRCPGLTNTRSAYTNSEAFCHSKQQSADEVKEEVNLHSISSNNIILTTNLLPHSQLKKLSSIEDRGQADRVTALPSPHAQDIDL